MVRHYIFGLTVLVACSLIEGSPFTALNHERSIHYVPFYGGGKGKFLEIARDSSGKIKWQKVVSEEDAVTGESGMNNNNENIVVKILAVNLQKIKSLSTTLLKLTNLGRKTGSLGETDKIKYENQLVSTAEAASNILKIIDEIDNVDSLFTQGTKLKNGDGVKEDDYSDEEVSEEGVSIEAPNDDGNYSVPEHGTVAEAKPVGLAVIGEHGLAASKPLATAVAATGAAIARPIATAIAGIDPSALGINFQINHEYSRNKRENKTL